MLNINDREKELLNDNAFRPAVGHVSIIIMM